MVETELILRSLWGPNTNITRLQVLPNCRLLPSLLHRCIA